MRGSSLMSNRGLRTTYALSMRAHPPPPRVVRDEAWGRPWWPRHVARSQRLRSLGRELVAGWRRYAYQGQPPTARWPPVRGSASSARGRVVSRCSVVYVCGRVALGPWSGTHGPEEPRTAPSCDKGGRCCVAAATEGSRDASNGGERLQHREGPATHGRRAAAVSGCGDTPVTPRQQRPGGQCITRGGQRAGSDMTGNGQL